MKKAPLLFLALGWTACDLAPVNCTLIGCADGLTIDVVTDETGDRDIDIAVEVGGETFSCAGTFHAVDGLACGEVFLFPTPDGFTIQVPSESEDDAHLTVDGFEADVPIAWTTSFPNGEECGPECLQGTGTVTVP